MPESFESHRSLLFGIAYRMLGTAADAEDMVQEAFVRWQAQPPGVIQTPKAWLISTVTRLSIDQLRTARRQREHYVGVWLPEPLAGDDPARSPDAQALLVDSLGIAFVHLLQELNPVERAVFLLREAFDRDYAEIAAIVDRNEAACRQMFSRAKAQLGKSRPASESVSDDKAEAIVRKFMAACSTGDLAGFLAVLTNDAILFSDGGAKMKAARLPIRSADRVARFFVGLHERAFANMDVHYVRVNGEIGVIMKRPSGRIDVGAFSFEADRINRVYLVSNPDKLKSFIQAGFVDRVGQGTPAEEN